MPASFITCSDNILCFMNVRLKELETYFIGSCSQCLVVHFMPFSSNASLYGSVVHKIAPDVSSSVVSRRVPAQDHVVLEGLLQGHTGGFTRYGCDESKQAGQF